MTIRGVDTVIGFVIGIVTGIAFAALLTSFGLWFCS